MRSTFALIAILGIPFTAVGKPVYLTCVVESPWYPNMESEVTLDESLGKATVLPTKGTGKTFDAVFSSNEVRYGDVSDLNFMQTTQTYIINRTDLTVTLETKMTFFDGPRAGTEDVKTRTGKCSIVAAPKQRLF